MIIFSRKELAYKARLAPQVLQIDHDDALSLSGDEEISSSDDDSEVEHLPSSGYASRANSGRRSELDVRPKGEILNFVDICGRCCLRTNLYLIF